MKKFLVALMLLFAGPVFAADEGLFLRADCETLSPVANKTLCQQTGNTAGRNAGFYSWNGASWIAVGGTGGAGTPGGADTQVQYNSAGSFAGDPGFTFNAATDAVTATTFIGALTGNATTATALAANGANCTAGSYPLGVDASGAVESCTVISAAAGGNNTEVQFNDSGAIAGDTGMTFNKTTNVLTATGGFVGNLTGTASTATNALALDAGASVTNGQLPTTITDKTLGNSNTVTLLDTLFTLQDNADSTKQGRFDLSAQTTGTISTYGLPVGSTTLLGDSDAAGTHTGPWIRTGSSTYKVCRDNDVATTAPGATNDSSQNYCVGSMWYDTVLGKWHRAKTVGVGTATWQDLGATTEADTLATVMGRGNAAVAESYATGLKITNTGATVVVSRFVDATFGPRDQCSPECDARTWIPTNKNYTIYDEEGAATMLTIDPDAASKNAMYQFGAAYRPLKSVSWSAGALSTDGTQCAAPAEVTINSGAKRWTIICTDNDASTIYGEVEMPDSWDGGTVTLMGSFVQTAVDTAVMNSDVAMACRGNATTINNTWGTEIAMDIAAMTGSSGINKVTTAAITPDGTCTGGGKLLQFRWQLDAAGTTTAVATLHVLGFKLEYSTSSLSD